MRLGSSTIPAEQEEIKSFAKWILSIGDGDKEANEYGDSAVCVPEDLERGILAPTLDAVEQVNEYVMSMIP
ncbi:ATP-dependent DNA helicase PIF1, partial [Trifolium medium]|nr:ATP-dependent DNA helicase PIF1 [Trifolium medium]